MTTPILFLVFNRPGATARVYEEIRKAKPLLLFIAADGPRNHREDDVENCRAVREMVLKVDWDCQVETLFQEENLGCGKAVSTAISWFFEHVEEGIILEDDCLPMPEFFPFCTELLCRFRYDNRIMQIGGNNLLPPHRRSHTYSYSFSNSNIIWGWATWKRAWDYYDYHMSQYEKIRNNEFFKKHFTSVYEEEYFNFVFKRTYHFPQITWDYQWEFARRINSGLTIVPEKNLVINIGFGNDATHTTKASGPSSRLLLEKIEFPLKHPPFVMVDRESDKASFILHHTTRKSRLKTLIKWLLPQLIRKKIFKYSFRHSGTSTEPNTQLH